MVEVSATTSPKKGAGSKKKAKSKGSHPPTSEMVNAAIKNLKERGGSSLQAIKKYIASNYKVDVDRNSTFIRRYLKSAVAKGSLIQTKGKGANGSFKIGGTAAGEKVDKKKKKKTTQSKKKKQPKKAGEGAAKKVKKASSSGAKKAAAGGKEKKSKASKKVKSPKPKKATTTPKSKKAAPKKK